MGECQMILNQEETCSNVSRYFAQMRKDMSLYGRKVVEIDSNMLTEEKRLFVKHIGREIHQVIYNKYIVQSLIYFRRMASEGLNLGELQRSHEWPLTSLYCYPLHRCCTTIYSLNQCPSNT